MIILNIPKIKDTISPNLRIYIGLGCDEICIVKHTSQSNDKYNQ
jgi:hypothetical protein